MVELPEAWKAIVNILLEATIAWQTPATIAEVLGRDVEETTDLLSLMDEAGWIDVWDADPVPLVILSALAAERLHIHLIEVGPNEVPRWARAGDPLPPLPRARNVSRLEQAAALDLVADARPSPDVEAERAESVESLSIRLTCDLSRRGPNETLPSPTLLRGESLTPWPGPGRSGQGPCPACGGQPLRPHEYCLCCDRWGLDALLPRVAPPVPRRPYVPSIPEPNPKAKARQEQSQAERERLRRKARRKARQKAKREADRVREQQREARVGRTPPATGTTRAEGPQPG
jgi:hypothetical protein